MMKTWYGYIQNHSIKAFYTLWFLTVPEVYRPLKHIKDTHTHTHTLQPLGCRSSGSLTRTETDTCQQSPPCLPLAALTMSSAKATPAEGDWKPFFSLPKALLLDFFLGVHSPQISTVFSSLMLVLPQLLTQRAQLFTQPQSWYCPLSSEALALAMQSN